MPALPEPFKMKMMPGQEPYTDEELKRLEALVAAAAEEDPGEENEETYLCGMTPGST